MEKMRCSLVPEVYSLLKINSHPISTFGWALQPDIHTQCAPNNDFHTRPSTIQNTAHSPTHTTPPPSPTHTTLPLPSTYSGVGSVAMVVGGLQSPQERDTITRLSLQLPVVHQLGDELGLLV